MAGTRHEALRNTCVPDAACASAARQFNAAGKRSTIHALPVALRAGALTAGAPISRAAVIACSTDAQRGTRQSVMPAHSGFGAGAHLVATA